MVPNNSPKIRITSSGDVDVIVTQTVYRLDARGGGGIQENYVGNDLLKKDNEKTIFYLKNLFDSEIMPIFAASRSNSWLRR